MWKMSDDLMEGPQVSPMFGGEGEGGESEFNVHDDDSVYHHVNVTVILQMIKQLTHEERLAFYRMFGFKHRNDLLMYLNDFNKAENNTVLRYEEELMQYGSYQARKFLLAYIPPILIVLGTFGNVFSFIILRNKAMLKFSTYFYLMVMSVADTLVLYVGLLRLWLGEVSGLDIKDRTAWTCKLTNVLGYTVSDFAVWLIIIVTAERYLVVCHPFKATSMCDTVRARQIISCLLGLFLTLNFHFFWTISLRHYTHNNETIIRCDFDDHILKDIWPWVDIMTYSLLPFILITALNILIIRQVLIARGERSRMRQGGVTGPALHSGSGGYPGGVTGTGGCGGIAPGGVALSSGCKYQQRRPSQEGSTRLTLMLLTISFTFLITTLPFTLMNIIANFRNRRNDGPGTRSIFELLRTITQLLMYTNHSMNFFLYCATGQKFRHQLVWMVCYAKRTYCVRRRRGQPGGTPGQAVDIITPASRLDSAGQARSTKTCNGRAGRPGADVIALQNLDNLKKERRNDYYGVKYSYTRCGYVRSGRNMLDPPSKSQIIAAASI